MKYLYIASISGFSGKSLVTLGLGLILKEKGYKVGYIKPFGKVPQKYEKKLIDADAEFMRKALDIQDPPEVVSPFVATFEAQQSLLIGKPSDKFKEIKKAFKSIKDKDIVLVGGGADLYEGSVFGINTLKIINYLKAPTLMVDSWKGDSSIDSVLGAKQLLADRLAGVVINKVPRSAHDYIEKSVRPFLERSGIPVFASFQRDILLDSITVRQLNDILNGKVLCCEENLDDFIENFSIGAMDVDSAMKYFKRTPNKAVITGAHRSDIQLAALETSTKCIILTGGLYANEVITGKAKASGIPIISVSDDTYSTVEKIESTLGKIRIREQTKILKIKEIVEKEFDLNRLLKALEL
jgi:uncharacterized protein